MGLGSSQDLCDVKWAMSTEETLPSVGRNEPCPCGSGKKYKRCHGVNAEPKLSQPKASLASGEGAEGLPGNLPFDPSQFDPAMMMKIAQAFQRLPRPQMVKLQSLVQRAMAGQDVSREAAELERMLPPDLRDMLQGFQIPQGLDQGGGAPLTEDEQAVAAPVGMAPSADMTPDQAREIVQKALAEGKISKEQAATLLGGTESEAAAEPSVSESSDEGTGLKKLWKSFRKSDS